MSELAAQVYDGRGSSADRQAATRPGQRASDLHVSPSRLANYWGVHVNTIYRDIRKGALKAFKVGASGQLRIRMSDARKYGRPVE
jgi:excisionase family DNA binding protein